MKRIFDSGVLGPGHKHRALVCTEEGYAPLPLANSMGGSEPICVDPGTYLVEIQLVESDPSFSYHIVSPLYAEGIVSASRTNPAKAADMISIAYHKAVLARHHVSPILIHRPPLVDVEVGKRLLESVGLELPEGYGVVVGFNAILAAKDAGFDSVVAIDLDGNKHVLKFRKSGD